jgi:NADH-quinone oxidoreductase subunit N
MYTANAFTQFVKVVLLASVLAAVCLSVRYFKAEDERPFEFYVLMILATIGMGIMVSANHLLTLYIGLEMQSLALYVLAALRRKDGLAIEAGLKYFILGALASALLLFGTSFLYGATGSLGYDGIAVALGESGSLSLPAVVGLVFILAGFAFKVSAAPFHMWTPDVYQGAPTNVTAFFAVAPKVAALAALIKFLVVPLHVGIEDGRQILLLLAVASMVVGAFGALRSESFKRLMAYSTINHMGYILLAVAMVTKVSVAAVLMYLVVYAVTSVGLFALALRVVRGNVYSDKLSDWAGLARQHPGMALCGAVFLLSLAGIPPMAGFFAKLFVFEAIVEKGFIGFAVAGVIASVVAAYYYLRLCKVMYFDDAPEGRVLLPVKILTGISVGAALMVLGFLAVPEPLLVLAREAAEALFNF